MIKKGISNDAELWKLKKITNITRWLVTFFKHTKSIVFTYKQIKITFFKFRLLNIPCWHFTVNLVISKYYRPVDPLRDIRISLCPYTESVIITIAKDNGRYYAFISYPAIFLSWYRQFYRVWFDFPDSTLWFFRFRISTLWN